MDAKQDVKPNFSRIVINHQCSILLDSASDQRQLAMFCARQLTYVSLAPSSGYAKF